MAILAMQTSNNNTAMQSRSHNQQGDRAANYPMYHKLAAAVLERAFDDLRNKDPVIRVDARVWLWLDGMNWLDLLNMDIQPQAFAEKVLNGGFDDDNQKYKPRRRR